MRRRAFTGPGEGFAPAFTAFRKEADEISRKFTAENRKRIAELAERNRVEGEKKAQARAKFEADFPSAPPAPVVLSESARNAMELEELSRQNREINKIAEAKLRAEQRAYKESCEKWQYRPFQG